MFTVDRTYRIVYHFVIKDGESGYGESTFTAPDKIDNAEKFNQLRYEIAHSLTTGKPEECFVVILSLEQLNKQIKFGK